MTDRFAIISSFLTIAYLSLFFTAVQAGQLPTDLLIVPGERVGPITAATSERMLETLFGAENVEPADVQLGEGFTAPGTVIYPDDAARRIEVVWQDSARTVPKEVRLTGDSSVWRTPECISLGSTLKEIERLNGVPFPLYGFAWDYGGTIRDCGGGRLKMLGSVNPEDARVLGRLVVLSLEPDIEARKRPEYEQVIGDRFFSSGHSAMQALNPRVYQMIVLLSQ